MTNRNADVSDRTVPTNRCDIVFFSCVQFQSLGTSQREVMQRTLTVDIERMMAELDPRDPEYSRLQEQLRHCNQTFSDLKAKVDEEGESDFVRSRLGRRITLHCIGLGC